MTNQPQSWQNCDDDIKQYVESLVAIIADNLSGSLVGIYLHGSLAMGGYYRPKSDIDLLVVVKEKLKVEVAKSASQAIAHYSKARPTVGDIELSVITLAVAQKPSSPMPFEFHNSSEWTDKILNDEVSYLVGGTDIDLNSHVMYVVKRGIALYGEPIQSVFGTPKWNDFMAAVVDDFEWIISDKHILETPFYGVLNICRVLQLLKENDEQPYSKDEGGLWALENLPVEYSRVIQQALDVYRSSSSISSEQRRRGGVEWNDTELLSFCEYARTQVPEVLASE